MSIVVAADPHEGPSFDPVEGRLYRRLTIVELWPGISWPGPKWYIAELDSPISTIAGPFSIVRAWVRNGDLAAVRVDGWPARDGSDRVHPFERGYLGPVEYDPEKPWMYTVEFAIGPEHLPTSG